MKLIIALLLAGVLCLAAAAPTRKDEDFPNRLIGGQWHNLTPLFEWQLRQSRGIREPRPLIQWASLNMTSKVLQQTPHGPVLEVNDAERRRRGYAIIKNLPPELSGATNRIYAYRQGVKIPVTFKGQALLCDVYEHGLTAAPKSISASRPSGVSASRTNSSSRFK